MWWDGGGDGTSWHDRFDWSTDVLPGPGDDVLIDVVAAITVVHSQGTDSIDSLTCNEELVLSGGSLSIAPAPAINNDFTQSGDSTFTGSGDLNAGEAGPGGSAGELTIAGTHTQTVAGTLTIELGGTMPASEHDVLTIDGDALPAGFLTLPRLGPFLPQVGQQFTILTTTGTVHDQFDQVDCPALYQVVHLSDRVMLNVIQSQPLGDINCDGIVDVLDLLALLLNWT